MIISGRLIILLLTILNGSPVRHSILLECSYFILNYILSLWYIRLDFLFVCDIILKDELMQDVARGIVDGVNIFVLEGTKKYEYTVRFEES